MIITTPWKESEKLKRWFLTEKRDLPWRNDPSPYKVWISEMMLQQTQVAVVIPYFERWMQRFPKIKDLAEAHIDEVIKMWEGLGYYSRARYLHAGAQTVMELFNGELPSDPEKLKKIKGLGAYTIGAIRSFAFHQRTAAVDGNVLRVLSRYFSIVENIHNTSVRKRIWGLAEDLLPEQESWIINEALIELGATVCKKKPQCPLCPLRSSCQGFLKGHAGTLPIKNKPKQIELLYRAVAVIIHSNGSVLLRRGKKGEIMSDLHEFPYFETSSEGMCPEGLKNKISYELNLVLQIEKELEQIHHSFTRYRVALSPVLFSTNIHSEIEGYFWAPCHALEKMAFSSGHKRILHNILSASISKQYEGDHSPHKG